MDTAYGVYPSEHIHKSQNILGSQKSERKCGGGEGLWTQTWKTVPWCSGSVILETRFVLLTYTHSSVIKKTSTIVKCTVTLSKVLFAVHLCENANIQALWKLAGNCIPAMWYVDQKHPYWTLWRVGVTHKPALWVMAIKAFTKKYG